MASDLTVIIICFTVIVVLCTIVWWLARKTQITPFEQVASCKSDTYEGIASVGNHPQVTNYTPQSLLQTSSQMDTMINSRLPTFANRKNKNSPISTSNLNGSQITTGLTELTQLENLLSKNKTNVPAPLTNFMNVISQPNQVSTDISTHDMSGATLQLTSGAIYKGQFPSNPSSVYGNLGLYATTPNDDINIVTKGGNFSIYSDGGTDPSVWVSPNGELNAKTNVNVDRNVNVGGTITASQICFTNPTPNGTPVCMSYNPQTSTVSLTNNTSFADN